MLQQGALRNSCAIAYLTQFLPSRAFNHTLELGIWNLTNIPALRMTFNFDTKAGRVLGNGGGTLRLFHDLDGMHWLRLHPIHTPSARMYWILLARDISNAAVSAMITNMRRSTPGIPIQEETRPAVVMHWYGRARRRHADFEHAYECVFEDHLVAIRGGLYGVVAVGETRFVLSVDVRMRGPQYYRTHDQGGDKSSLSGEENSF
jgi:hypothetical protein